MSTARDAALLLLVAIFALGCDSPRVVDGWQLGGAEGCADTPFGGDNTVPCAVQMREIISVATKALNRRDPGHPPAT